MKRIPFALGLLLALAATGGFAAEQLKDTRLILVKNPSSDPSKRKILWRVKEPGSINTISGDPIANGATVRISLTPGGDQCFQLPAGNWSALSADGYRYNDSDLSEGAVRSAYIKRVPNSTSPTSRFHIRVFIKGDGPEAITVTPGDPTTDWAVNFRIGGGDEYCGGPTSVSPRVPARNDAVAFKVRNEGDPDSCTVSPCSPGGAFLDAPDASLL